MRLHQRGSLCRTIIIIISSIIINGCTRLVKAADSESNTDVTSPSSTGEHTEIHETDDPYSPPTELEVIRLNDSSVVLRWEIHHALQDNVQFFKIQYKLTKKTAEWKTDPQEIPASSRARQINGLRPGNYFFIVSAVYDNDDNKPSQQLKFQLRASSKISDYELPEKTAPTIFRNLTSHDWILFRWKYPVKERDIPWFGYLVYYRSAHSVSDYLIYNTLDESVEIAQLEPDTPYEVKVVAYNRAGVSDFSETKTIKTKPLNATKSDSTNSAPNSMNSTTTLSPISTNSADITLGSTTLKPTSRPTTATSYEDQSPTSTISSGPVDVVVSSSETTMKPMRSPTVKPHNEVVITILNDTSAGVGAPTKSTKTQTLASLSDVLNHIMTARDDTTLAIKYSLFFLMPMIVITSILICLVSCHEKRKSPPPSSSTSDSGVFDMEINSYFKNSFPGVEKDLTMMVNIHHGHQGFVNNHPLIHDNA